MLQLILWLSESQDKEDIAKGWSDEDGFFDEGVYSTPALLFAREGRLWWGAKYTR
jgi:hypothetical protein